MGPHVYPLQEIDNVYYKIHEFTGQYWFPNLLLSAKPTSEGLVVIGRLLGQRWLQTLGRREIKRCQNNGLLYKIISQNVLHKNYHIPQLETIPGEGFTSFEEIRFNRPKMYIKYWKIWNIHMNLRKKFFMENEKKKWTNDKWFKEHNCPLPNWSELRNKFHKRGLENVVIPPPTLEQIQNMDFDPWEYCDDWVKTNCFENFDKPHFPPMYIDYPEPESMRFRPFMDTTFREKEITNLDSPRRTKHYRRNPDEWIEFLTVRGKQWMQIYF